MRMPAQPKAHGSRCMQHLPPLDALPFFEAAARNESFVAAGQELNVTPTAIAHRVRTLEASLGDKLFVRLARGVRLTRPGEAYLKDVQRILSDLWDVTKRHRSRGQARVLRIVATEVVAKSWLMPRLAEFKAARPDITIEFEIDDREIGADGRDYDAWIAFTNEVEQTPHAETLFEEALVPVCSPAFLSARGPLRKPHHLREWPLLYNFEWESYWAYWFAHHDAPPPDLTRASGFRLYSMTVQAAVHGMGVALGHSAMIAHELERGSLTALVEPDAAVPARYVLKVPPSARNNAEVRAFRDWAMDQASRMRAANTSALTAPAQ